MLHLHARGFVLQPKNCSRFVMNLAPLTKNLTELNSLLQLWFLFESEILAFDLFDPKYFSECQIVCFNLLEVKHHREYAKIPERIHVYHKNDKNFEGLFYDKLLKVLLNDWRLNNHQLNKFIKLDFNESDVNKFRIIKFLDSAQNLAFDCCEEFLSSKVFFSNVY